MTPFNDLRKLRPGRIVTVAGVGYDEGIPARDADAGWPMGVVRRGDGELIVVDYWAPSALEDRSPGNSAPVCRRRSSRQPGRRGSGPGGEDAPPSRSVPGPGRKPLFHRLGKCDDPPDRREDRSHHPGRRLRPAWPGR